MEVFPNPEGSDNGEWIKLYNNGNYPVNLGGWVLDDEEGGSAPYHIPSDVVIGAKNFFALEKGKTGITLNNDGDEARLFNPNGDLKSKMEYDKVAQGEVKKLEIGNLGTRKLEDVEGVKVKNVGDGKESEIKKVKIENWELEQYTGYEISIEGYVSVEPGILGKQVFYITNGIKGIEVYSWAKDFPDLERGDYISVFGKLENKEGWRVSAESIDDISILSYEHPPLAKEKAISDIKEGDIHSLIMVKGQIVEKKSPNLYLDDGKNEIKIYIKDSTAAETKDFKVGDSGSVIGILDYLNGAYRLLPRDNEDLRLQTGAVLGAQSEGHDEEIEVLSRGEAMNEFNNEDGNWLDMGKIIILLSSTLAVLAFIMGVIYYRNNYKLKA